MPRVYFRRRSETLLSYHRSYKSEYLILSPPKCTCFFVNRFVVILSCQWKTNAGAALPSVHSSQQSETLTLIIGISSLFCHLGSKVHLLFFGKPLSEGIPQLFRVPLSQQVRSIKCIKRHRFFHFHSHVGGLRHLPTTSPIIIRRVLLFNLTRLRFVSLRIRIVNN